MRRAGAGGGTSAGPSILQRRRSVLGSLLPASVQCCSQEFVGSLSLLEATMSVVAGAARTTSTWWSPSAAGFASASVISGVSQWVWGTDTQVSR